MNKFTLTLSAIMALSLISSCGDFSERSPSVVQAQQTVPAVTFWSTTTSTTLTTAAVTSSLNTTTTQPPILPDIIITKGISPYSEEIPSEYYIDAEQIYQEPELPSGCEITSLTMLLNYLGFDADKVDLCDNYLEKDYTYNKNFSQAFIGNPKDGTGYGCYAPVITKAAQKYLAKKKSDLDIYDLSGTDFRELFSYIADDKPIVIWASMGLVNVNYYNAFTTDKNENVYWYENEHCMLLTGYDIYNETVTVCDPLRGEYTYNMNRFEEIYNELEKQAVTIY